MRNFIRPMALSIFIFALCNGADASDLLVPRLRTDQYYPFSCNDKSPMAFWSKFTTPFPVDTTIRRLVRYNPNNFGTVRISVRVGASLESVYLYIHCAYSQKAPSLSTPTVPLDGFALTWSPDSLAAALKDSFIVNTGARFYLSSILDSAMYWMYSFYSAGASYNSGICTKVIDSDSLNKIVEMSIPWKMFYNALPAAGSRFAFQLIYYTMNPLSANPSFPRNTVGGDKIDSVSNRIFLGNLSLSGPFNDTAIMFTSPVKNDQLTAGCLHTISWATSILSGNVGLQFSFNGGQSWDQVVLSTVNDGAFPWQFPFVASNNCLVRMVWEPSDAPIDTTEVFSMRYPVPILFSLPAPLTTQKPLFQWRSVVNASKYRIVIASDPACKSIVADDSTLLSPAYSRAAAFAPGAYYWKVASDLDFTLFSAIDSFVVPSHGTSVRLAHAAAGNGKRLSMGTGNAVSFEVRKAGPVTVDVADLSGRMLGELRRGYFQQGTYTVGMGGLSTVAGEGIYVVRLRAAGYTEALRCSLVH